MTAHISTDLLPPERLTFAEIQRRRAEQHGFPIDHQPHNQREEQTRPSPPAPSPLRDSASPRLPVAALHGYAGLAVRTIAPHTEAHPASILLQLLAAFGNMVGPGPHCMVDATRHGLNLFLVLVGDSSKARKGTSWSQIARLFAEVDQPWLSTRVTAARLTAGGLVHTLRDQQPPTDRRLLALSEEFASVLRMLKSGNGHLSPLLRCAWDSGHLPALDMHQPEQATGTHISLIAHITQRELTPISTPPKPITALPTAASGPGSNAATACPTGEASPSMIYPRSPASSAAPSIGPPRLPKSSSVATLRPASFGRIAIPA
jgi:hypothetical protein